MRWLALAMVLVGLAGMFLPVIGLDPELWPAWFLETLSWAGFPPIGLALVVGGGILLTRSLRRSGIGLSDPRAWRRFRSNKGALAGGILVALVIGISFVGPLVAP